MLDLSIAAEPRMGSTDSVFVGMCNVIRVIYMLKTGKSELAIIPFVFSIMMTVLRSDVSTYLAQRDC